MARDYSSRKNVKKRGPRQSAKRPRSPAKRNRKPAARGSAGARSGATGCIWLLCGVFLAIAAGAGYYIASRPAGHGPESVQVKLPPSKQGNQTTSAAGSAQSTGKPHKSSKKQSDKPQFAFYKMLPNYKVEVPGDNQASATGGNSQGRPSKPQAHKAQPSQAVPKPQKPAASNSTSNAGQQHTGRYVIQAGAFSTRTDAEHRQARLTLLGVTADILTIHTGSGKIVYRVQSQPVSSSRKAHSLEKRLKSHGIDTLIRSAQ